MQHSFAVFRHPSLLVFILPLIVLLPLVLEWLDLVALDSAVPGIASLIDGGRLQLGFGSSSGEQRLRARPIGSLHELVAQSKSLWDARTPVDKLKHSSSRVLPVFGTGSLFAASGDKREHILVTGGFGSLGKHVVRDLLLLGRGNEVPVDNEWVDMDDHERSRRDPGVIVTLLDVAQRTDELEFLLRHLPNFHRARVLGAAGGDSQGTVGFDFVDPRSAAFAGQEMSFSAFVESGRLRVAQADVRNLTVLQQILLPGQYGDHPFTHAKTKLASHRISTEDNRAPPPISGVIHLAGYSHSDCIVNPADCRFVETEGARVLSAVFAEMDSNIRPWLVSANGPDANAVRDSAAPDSDTPFEEDVSQRPGKRKRQASPNQMHLSLQSLAAASRMHAISLRLPPDSHIVGDPFASRRQALPYLVRNALGHQPLHVNLDSFPSFSRPAEDDDWLGLGIMSNEDVVEAVLAAAELLARASQTEHLKRLSVMTGVDIVPPVAEPNMARDVVDFVLQLTRSESPISFQGFDGYTTPIGRSRLSPRKASKLLGLKRAESSTVFLRSYLASLLSLQGQYLERNVTELCAPPPSYADLVEAVLGANGCFVQLIAVIDGMTWSFACSQDLDEYAQPMAILNAVPHVEGVRGVRLSAERTDQGVGMQVGFSCPTGPGGSDEPVAWLAETAGAAEGFYTADLPGVGTTKFQLEFARRDTKAFTLALPSEGEGKPKRKMLVRDIGGVDSKLPFFPQPGETATQGDTVLELRINEICCSKQVSRLAHNFLREDPLYTSQIMYPSTDGFTTIADSTLPLQRCRSYRHALDHTKKMTNWLESSRSAQICPRVHGEGADWVAHEMPLCPVDCTAPVPCLVTDKCRCPQNRCPPHGNAGLGPFPSVAFTKHLSFGQDQVQEVADVPIIERLAAMSWSSVVLPQAWRAYSMPVDLLPRAHVVDIPAHIDNHLTKAECYELEAAPVPFSSDHIIIEALRERNAPLNESDFTIVPFYQGCYFNYIAENTYKKLADTVGYAETKIQLSDTVLASNIVLPFTHDWGSCTGWWPRHEEVLSRGPPPPMSKATAWQMNGDYSTKCIKSERDVVIPSRSRNTPELVSLYGDVSRITPAEKRQHLAFFAGGMRGFGAFARTRIGCSRVYGDSSSEVLYQAYALNSKYVDTLDQARFCLLPRGIPAWSTRTFEAIYAGCIPVFIADRNHFPFEDILDYSRFSLTIAENEIDLLDGILRSVDESQLARLQAAVLKLREAFVYVEGQGAEWARKGPVQHALISMAMRLTLQWPVTDAC